MKTQLLSLLAGTALIATVSVAQAGAPMALSESQMDQVTAGVVTHTLTLASATGLHWVQTGPDGFDLNFGPGVKTNITISFQTP